MTFDMPVPLVLFAFLGLSIVLVGVVLMLCLDYLDRRVA